MYHLSRHYQCRYDEVPRLGQSAADRCAPVDSDCRDSYDAATHCETCNICHKPHDLSDPPKKTTTTNKQKTTTNKQTTHLYAVGRKGSQLIITQQLTPVRTAQSKFHAKKSTVDVMFFSQAKVQQQSKKTTSQLVGALSPVNHRGLHQG